MSQALEPLTSENEATYESLISLIENNQDRLALIIVACDDLRLRQRVVDRYEAEARQTKIRSYRIVLGKEPSLRSELAKLALRQGDAAVVTVTGAEWLLRVKMREGEEQSDLDKFFGYLQWTREGLREFRVPIVLWVTHRILREISRQAPDFWSWRKAVLRFASQEAEPIPVWNEERLQRPQSQPDDEFLPPLEELLSEIESLESSSPESPNLATLYDQLGQVYANRIKSGKTVNLEQERQQAIDAFQNAIDRHQQLNNQSDLVGVLLRFGNFLESQSRYEDAIVAYQQSLEIAREIRNGEAASLNNLGIVYKALGQYARAIEFYQQSLEIDREIGDRSGEATSLNNLGNAYRLLGQYARAIELHQKSLEIQREIGDRRGEASSLLGLGNAYYSSEQYARAIKFHQQSLEIARDIGNRSDEAASLGNLGLAYYLLGQSAQAIEFYQQSLEIARDIDDRSGEASSLGNLGLAYYSLGQYAQAIEFHQQSLEMKRDIGDRNGEAGSLMGLGNAYYSLGQYQRAIELYQQSLEIKRDIGDRNGEASSLMGLGNAYGSLEQYSQAIEFYQQSLETMRDIGAYNGEAKVLGNLGTAYRSLGQYPQAIEFYQQSLDMMRDIGDRNGEANSLWNLSNIYQRRGQFKRSRSYRHLTYLIWQELDLPLEALPYPGFQKRLLRHLGDDWIKQQIENEQNLAWFIDTISLIVFLIRWLFSPIRWIQRRLRPKSS